jgi:hypothetical protein
VERGLDPSPLLAGDAPSPSSERSHIHKTKAHAPASAAKAATGTARLGALDGMNPGSCGYSGPLPGGLLPIPMYPPGDGGQFPEPPGYDAGGGGL